MKSKNLIKLKATAALSSRGMGMGEIWDQMQEPTPFWKKEDYYLNDFKAAAHLSDRRMLKAVSRRDGFGLAAIAMLDRDSEIKNSKTDHYRRGIYVGACPSAVSDNENYLDAVNATRDQSDVADAQKFGEHCMNARPTTLLLGLPNNVLCYGSMITETKGPNNNYTAAELSSVMALISAMRNMRSGRIDTAVVGGYSCGTDIYTQTIREQGKILKSPEQGRTLKVEAAIDGENAGCVYSDSAAFVSLAKDETKLEDNPVLIAGADIISVDLSDPLEKRNLIKRLNQAVRKILSNNKLEFSKLGYASINFLGLPEVDRPMLKAAQLMASSSENTIAAVTPTRVMGNLQESLGMIDFALAERVYRKGAVPDAISCANLSENFSRSINKNNNLAVSLVGSPTGNFGVVVFQVGR